MTNLPEFASGPRRRYPAASESRGDAAAPSREMHDPSSQAAPRNA